MFLRDERYLPFVERLLGEARATVRVSLYNATLKGRDAETSSARLLDALRLASRRGADVRVLLNAVSPAKRLLIYNDACAQFLTRKGCQVRRLKDQRCLHVKLVSVDDRCAVLGSHNWSFHSLRRNAELSWVVDVPREVRKLNAVFDELWRASVPWSPHRQPKRGASPRPEETRRRSTAR